MKLIAETAWHHQGDFEFMRNLVQKICVSTDADIVKMHVTLDFDEYMDKNHSAYGLLKEWLFDRDQWLELIDLVRVSGKELMLLLNDKSAIEFGISQDPEYVEIHSVCLNDIFLLDALKKRLTDKITMVLGVGGTDIYEIEHALNYINHPNILLMFGFQNYPTVYKDVNLNKIRRTMDLFRGADFGYADHTAWNNPLNELITLLGAASGMSYVEKHVTTKYGEERADWSAAISIEMFNALHEKLQVLNDLNGSGSLEMNQGELDYSIFGPMKKAAMFNRDVKTGEMFSREMVEFKRTSEVTDMSQIDIVKYFGKELSRDMSAGEIVKRKSFKL